MKKLMFALIAGVAASAVYAAPITQSDFETAEFAAGATVGESTVGDTLTYLTRFAYEPSGSSDNGSTVKAYGSGEGQVSAFGGTRNSAFSGTNAQYLELSTDGGTLYRTINGRDADHKLGTATNVTSSLYIDTLVQFTVCDSAPTIDENAKLAIWLQASEDETSTNLMVKAKQWTVAYDGDAVDTASATAAVYKISGTYNANTWYRLTVEDLGNVCVDGFGATGFKIRINGSYVAAADGVAFVTTGGASIASQAGFSGGTVQAAYAEGLATTGNIFMSLADGELMQANYSSSLCAVGFSGTGLVDDILFTEENPFYTAPTQLDFTLTLGANISSVTYSIDGAAGVTVTETTDVGLVPVSSAIALTITPATSAWRTYTSSVTAGDNVTVAGTTVTINTVAQGDANQTTAGATVSAVDSSAALEDSGVAAAFTTLGVTNEGVTDNVTTADRYRAFVTWAENNNYNVARVNGYEAAYTRFNLGLPIEMDVFVATNTAVANYTASVAGTAGTDTDPLTFDSFSYVKYTVDAGDSVALSDFAFASAGEGYQYLLDGDSANWLYSGASFSGLDSVTVNAASNGVTLATSVTAANAKVGIATVSVSTAPATIDFTLAFDTGVSSVTFTLGGVSYTMNAAGSITTAGEATITSVTYADWYVADDSTGKLVKDSAFTVVNEGSATVGAKLANASEIVTDSTTAADLGIDNAAFVSDTPAQLSKLAAWAQNPSHPVTISQVNAMSFSAGVPQDTTAEAYLLNCAPTAEAVAAAKAAFKFTSITPGTTPSISGDGYNGTVTVEGKAALSDATWGTVDANTRFYRATLTK